MIWKAKCISYSEAFGAQRAKRIINSSLTIAWVTWICPESLIDVNSFSVNLLLFPCEQTIDSPSPKVTRRSLPSNENKRDQAQHRRWFRNGDPLESARQTFSPNDNVLECNVEDLRHRNCEWWTTISPIEIDDWGRCPNAKETNERMSRKRRNPSGIYAQIDDFFGVFVTQVDRIDWHRIDHGEFIPNPADKRDTRAPERRNTKKIDAISLPKTGTIEVH